jgi:hypothetical protein
MIVLKVLDDAELVLADLEVNLGKQIRHAVTLCVRQNGNITPLNTPDGRPIQMREENTIQTIEETFDDDESNEKLMEKVYETELGDAFEKVENGVGVGETNNKLEDDDEEDCWKEYDEVNGGIK